LNDAINEIQKEKRNKIWDQTKKKKQKSNN